MKERRKIHKIYNLCLLVMNFMAWTNGKEILHIGAMFRIHRYDHFGYKTAVEFAVEGINKRQDILANYEIKVHFCDTWNDVGFALHCLYNFVKNPPTKIMLIGPESSKMIVPVASAADLWNLVQLSSAAFDANFEDASHFRLQFLTRNVPDFVTLNEARLSLLKHFKWKRVALLYEYDEPTTNEIVADMKTKLHKANIELVTMVGFGQQNNQTLIDQLDKLMELKVRVIIGDFGVHALRALFCQVYLRKLDISKYVWMFLDRYDPNWTKAKTSDIPCTREMLVEASHGFFAVKRSLLRKDQVKTVAGLTSLEYQTGYIEKVKNSRRRAEHWTVPAVVYDEVWAAALALNKSTNMNLTNFNYDDYATAVTINDNLRKLSFEGVTGPHKFNKKNSLLGCVSISQQRSGALVDVAKFCEENSVLSFYNNSLRDLFKDGKIPRDRVNTVFKVSRYNIATTATLFVLCFTGITMTIGFFYVNFKYKKERCIQASSPRLNILILIGGILMYTCAILFGLDTQYVPLDAYPPICMIQTWLMCFGFTLTFGAMFSKTWRVYRIFTASKSLRRIGNVTDTRLVSIVFAFLLVDVVIMVAWTVISPYEVKKTDFQPKELPSLDMIIVPRVVYCTCKHQDTFIFTVYAYKGVLLLFGLFLAWETRNVHIKDLNDSKYIGMSVYNVVIFATVGAMSSRLLEKSQHYEASYLIQSSALFLCTTAVLFCLYIPKILVIRNLDKNSPWLVSRTTVCTFVSENNSTTRPLYIATDVVDRGTQTRFEDDTETLSPSLERLNWKTSSDSEDDATRRLNLLVIKRGGKQGLFPESRRESLSSTLDTDIYFEEKGDRCMNAEDGEGEDDEVTTDLSKAALYALENGRRRQSASFIVDPGVSLINSLYTNTALSPNLIHPLTNNATTRQKRRSLLNRRRHSHFIIPGSNTYDNSRRSSSPVITVGLADNNNPIFESKNGTDSNLGKENNLPRGELFDNSNYLKVDNTKNHRNGSVGVNNYGYISSSNNSIESRDSDSMNGISSLFSKGGNLRPSESPQFKRLRQTSASDDNECETSYNSVSIETTRL